MNKILFITYYWPPSGKASLHLPLYLIKHLAGAGKEIFVLTVEEDGFSQQDSSLVSVIPPDVTVVKTGALEPFTLYRLFTGKKKNQPLVASETISKENRSLTHKISVAVRMNLFIPDARIGWYPYAVSAGSELIHRHGIETIVSIGPPHTAQLIGRTLARRHSLPFIPVLIDPWVDIAYYRGMKRSAVTLSIDNYLEAKVMHDAAKIIFVTKAMQHDYVNKYPRIKGKDEVLYWGYNEEPFEGVTKKREDSVFTIVHAGNIFDYQNPKEFFRLLAHRANTGRALRLKFIGTVSPGIKNTIADSGLDKYTEYSGFLPYAEVVQEMVNADLLMVGATEKRHLPGKLFEYLRTGNPVIAFGDDNPEMEELLRNANAGMLFPYSASGEEIFTNYLSFNPDTNYIRRFERKNLAEQLAGIIAGIHGE